METIQYINFKPPLCYDQSIKKPGRRLHTAHVSWAHTPMQLISLTLRLLWAPTLVRTSQSSFCFCCRSAGLRRSTSKQRETRTGNSEHQHLCLQVAFTDVTAGQGSCFLPTSFSSQRRKRSREGALQGCPQPPWPTCTPSTPREGWNHGHGGRGSPRWGEQLPEQNMAPQEGREGAREG